MRCVGERPWWFLQKPPKRKKEEGARLTEESDKIKSIDLGFERGQDVALGTGRRRPGVP